MISIQEILKRFVVRVSPEKRIADAMNAYFKENNIEAGEIGQVHFSNNTIKVFGGPYISSYIRINKEKLLTFLKEKTAFQNIKDIN